VAEGGDVNDEMTADRFVAMMRAKRARWEGQLGRIDRDEMELPGVAGDWSARDLIVHVTAYERGLVEWLEAAGRGEIKTFPILDHPDLDWRNAAILEASRGRSLAEVEAEASRVWDRLLALVEALPDQTLVDPEQTEWFVKPRWGERRPLWECIADDGIRHYDQHVPDLEQWLEREEN
jgi:hypothetical protein